MTLTFCRIFNMIVLHGSFVKAAEALSMTPSAVSHAVADAEAAVGFPLFNRTKKGITLTENGKELYVSVLQMIQSEDSLQQKIDQLNRVCAKGQLVWAFSTVSARIGCPRSLSASTVITRHPRSTSTREAMMM